MEYRVNRQANPVLPPVILNLLIANGMVFFFQSYFRGGVGAFIIQYFALWPLGVGDWVQHHPQYVNMVSGFYPWQVLTYGFLHGNMTHILLNMFALWMFGRDIELRWGSARFGLYYFVCLVGAGLTQLLVSSLSVRAGHFPYPTIGASGGTFGILLAFGMLFPYRRLIMLFFPIPIEARFFVIIYGGLELFLGVSGLSSGIAHFAHIGGMLFGLVLILYWRGKLPLKPKERMYW